MNESENHKNDKFLKEMGGSFANLGRRDFKFNDEYGNYGNKKLDV